MLRLLSFWLQKFYLVLFADSIPRKVVKGTVVAEEKKSHQTTQINQMSI